MSNLTDASRELFKRQPDECFPSLTALWEHCQRQKEACVDRWVAPRSIRTNPHDAGRLLLAAGDDGAFEMNDWSFGQLCRLAGVAKETVNRLVPDTAARVFAETLPTGNKPLQLLTNDEQVRSMPRSRFGSPSTIRSIYTRRRKPKRSSTPCTSARFAQGS